MSSPVNDSFNNYYDIYDNLYLSIVNLLIYSLRRLTLYTFFIVCNNTKILLFIEKKM